MRSNSALDAAISLSHSPNLASLMRIRELPGDVLLLLRILANDGDAIQEAHEMTGLNPTAIPAIAELYVKEVLLFSGAPPRRILGMCADASRVEARTNLRFLLSWLHPDKNPSKWQSAFAVRVIAAWQLVRDVQLADNPVQFTRGAAHHVHHRHRVPWIARPLAEVSPRQRFRVLGVFFWILVSLAALCSVAVPNSAVFSVYQNLVLAIFDDDPIVASSISEITPLNENGNSK